MKFQSMYINFISDFVKDIVHYHVTLDKYSGFLTCVFFFVCFFLKAINHGVFLKIIILDQQILKTEHK